MNVVALSLLASLLVCSATVLLARWRRRAPQLPPAPPGWRPVVGHMHLLGALPHQKLAELARQQRLSLMSLWLGSVPAIVASTPEAARLILKTHDQIFASRPTSAVNTHLGFRSSSISTSRPSTYWRRMRLLCFSDLLSPKRQLSFHPFRREGVHALLQAVFAQRHQVLPMRTKVFASILDSVSRMTVGQAVRELAPQAPELMHALLELSGSFSLGDFIPFLAPLDLQGVRQMKRVGQQWSAVLQKLVDVKRSQPRQSNDLLDTLLSTPDLTDDQIKGIVSDMFIGGSASTSSTIEWAFAELLENPIIMTTLKEELDSVVGRVRLVEEEDLPNLPFLHAIVKETLRLHPPAPFLIPHESLGICEVYGYSIPSKTRVLVNVWALSRDSESWDYPQKFDPKRFLHGAESNHVGVHGQHFQYLPFGSGRRQCPGLALGLLNVHIILASLVQAFDWNLPSSIKQVDFSERYGLSLTMASPLSIIPSPKLKPSLYHGKTFKY